MTPKKVQVDYLTLENQTCGSCVQTEQNLQVALNQLLTTLPASAYFFQLNKVVLDTAEKAVANQFAISPTIRVNGTDIGFEQKQKECNSNCCNGDEACCTDADCCNGDAACCADGNCCEAGATCRIWNVNGQELFVPTSQLLADRMLQVMYGKSTNLEANFELPQNLATFYSNKAQNQNCCGPNCC